MNKNLKWFLLAVVAGGGIFLFLKLNQKPKVTVQSSAASLISTLISGLFSGSSNNSKTPSGMDPSQLAIWNGD